MGRLTRPTSARHPVEKQDRVIEGSLDFGVYDALSGEQVITDLATFAWLCDVCVGPALVAAVERPGEWMALTFGP